MTKRIVLFLLTNLAVVLVLSITARILGVDRFLTANGLNLGTLLAFSALIGFGGSFISLAMSKWMAKMTTHAQIIDNPSNPTERWLVETVRRHAQLAGVGMPEVAIYEAPEINAFATGANRNHALVAVSTGLLQSMTPDEAEAVLGHEMTHVANGDMVTLTLVQGVVNTFVIFLSRIVGYVVDRVLLKNDRDSVGIGYYVTSIVAELVLGILASMIVLWFSRRREFRADAGGAQLAGREKMIGALSRLKAAYAPSSLPKPVEAFGISGKEGGGLARLFMSHPPLDERIAALRAGAVGSGLALAR
ncbi:MAG TPA: protease HtpX [Steroidobacteraceae bacterium]|nr:protease HtpX [Steroidobacteraceae bacterium]